MKNLKTKIVENRSTDPQKNFRFKLFFIMMASGILFESEQEKE